MNTFMRRNLPESVRLTVLAMGASTVALTNSLNSEVGRHTKTNIADDGIKTGPSRISGKVPEYSARTTVAYEHKGAATDKDGNVIIPLLFDAWITKVNAMEKVCPIKVAQPIPEMFHAWILKHKAVTSEVTPGTQPSTPLATKLPRKSRKSQPQTEQPAQVAPTEQVAPAAS